VLRAIWLRGAEQERMALAFVPALLFVIAAKFERLFPKRRSRRGLLKFRERFGIPL